MPTLTEVIDDVRSGPGYDDIRAQVKAKYARARTVPCPFKNCSVLVDPLDNTIISSFGRVGCACDSLPGWKKHHVEQMSKPRAAVKAVGRNGSRVQRSKRRHRDVTPDGIMVWAARLMEAADD